MLLDIDYLVANPLLVGGLTLGIVVIKALPGMLFGPSPRPSSGPW